MLCSPASLSPPHFTHLTPLTSLLSPHSLLLDSLASLPPPRFSHLALSASILSPHSLHPTRPKPHTPTSRPTVPRPPSASPRPTHFESRVQHRPFSAYSPTVGPHIESRRPTHIESRVQHRSYSAYSSTVGPHIESRQPVIFVPFSSYSDDNTASTLGCPRCC